MMDTRIFSYLESRLDFAARRQQALSNNIANLDTPGYKTQDVEFADELSGATSTISWRKWRTGWCTDSAS